MKKADFYDHLKTNVYYLTGLRREAWYKDGGDIVVQTSNRLVAVRFNRNHVMLYTKVDGEKSETVSTDYNYYYRDNMVTLTAEKIYKFLTVK